jgi:hypothetical protein
MPAAAKAPVPEASIKRNTPRPSTSTSTSDATAPDIVAMPIDNRPTVNPAVAARASLEAPVIPPVAERPA